jgi:hypothetical protein
LLTDAADSLGEAKLAARLIPVARALAEGAAAGGRRVVSQRAPPGTSRPKQVKVGPWKEPYRRARACLEIVRRAAEA